MTLSNGRPYFVWPRSTHKAQGATRAAFAWEPNRPLEIGEIDLDGPKEGDMLIRIVTYSPRDAQVIGRAVIDGTSVTRARFTVGY